MKIVISSYTFLPDIGGVASHVSILADACARAGHDVTVLTLTSASADMTFPYTVIRNPGLLALWRHMISADMLIMSNLSLKLCYPLLIWRRPFILWHHSERAWRELRGGVISADTLRRMIIKRAHHCMTSAYCGRESGFSQYMVAHPFANPHYITSDIIRPSYERKDILFVGRLEPEKGIIWLIERIALLRDILGHHRLCIIGDGSLRHEIEQIARNSLYINYHGRMTLRQTANAMGQAAYAIIPSLWAEPFGSVASESLAAGAVTIHSNRGGLPETTGTLGYQYDPDDDASLVQALQDARAHYDALCEDAQKEQDYRSAVKAHIAQFHPDHVVKRLCAAMQTHS